MEECDRYAVKLSPQSFLVKSLCLMVYSCKNENADLQVNMTQVPIVYGPLSSFINRDDGIDLELSCLSQMSITVIYFPNIIIHPVLLEFISDLFELERYKWINSNTSMPRLQSMVHALLINHSLFNCYHLDMSTSSKFMIF